MIARFSLFLSVFLAATSIAAQDQPAYTIYNAKGKTSNYSKMLKAMQGADVVLFGELHDNPIVHWLQYETTRSLIASKGPGKVRLGAEMFEADVQQDLNRYLAGDTTLSEK
ncbi:MAG: ChaN family lipoprotein, partial [Bacteroidota bacterium]